MAVDGTTIECVQQTWYENFAKLQKKIDAQKGKMCPKTKFGRILLWFVNNGISLVKDTITEEEEIREMNTLLQQLFSHLVQGVELGCGVYTYDQAGKKGKVATPAMIWKKENEKFRDVTIQSMDHIYGIRQRFSENIEELLSMVILKEFDYE